MPQREFELNRETIAPFMNKLNKAGLDATFSDISEDGESVFMEVFFSNKESKKVLDLIDLLDKYESDEEENEEEETEEDDEQ